jgi:hypothetical protein
VLLDFETQTLFVLRYAAVLTLGARGSADEKAGCDGLSSEFRLAAIFFADQGCTIQMAAPFRGWIVYQINPATFLQSIGPLPGTVHLLNPPML